MTNYLINLKRREDRLESAKKEFAWQNMEFIRSAAFDMSPGWVGCLKSHLYILSGHVEGILAGRPWASHEFGIYEDDIRFIFCPTTPAVAECMSELPPDWDVLYLGCSPQEPFERYSEHLYKMGKNHTTHAIIWHYRPGGAIDYILSKDWDMKYDLLLSEHIHPNFNCFCTYPMICSQYSIFKSDTCKRSDTTTIVKNYNKFCG